MPAVLAIIGIVVGAYFALNPRSPQPVNHLAACQQAHPGAHGSVAASGTRLGVPARVEGCRWPPVTGTDSNGFWTASVTVYPIAGASAASPFDYVEVFTTSCQALSLDYQFNSSTTIEHKRFTVQTNQTVSGYTGAPVPLSQAGNVPAAVLQAEGTHLIIPYNSNYILQQVGCATIP